MPQGILRETEAQQAASARTISNTCKADDRRRGSLQPLQPAHRRRPARGPGHRGRQHPRRGRRDARESATSTWSDGRFFTEQEERTRQAVCRHRRGPRDGAVPDRRRPWAARSRFRGIDFLVVGVQEKLGSAFGRSQDNRCLHPVHGVHASVRNGPVDRGVRARRGREPG